MYRVCSGVLVDGLCHPSRFEIRWTCDHSYSVMMSLRRRGRTYVGVNSDTSVDSN
jgi:hypothetical protein